MAGFFDFLTPDDPMKQQGLLQAAAAMLQGAGDPRHPFGFGQALGAGVGAYQGSMQQQQLLQQKMQDAQQEQALRALQIKGAEGELDDKAQSRKDSLDARNFYLKYNQPGQSDQPSQTAIAQRILGNNMAPTVANAAKLTDTQPESAAPAAAQSPDLYTQRLRQAQAMRASGNPALIQAADALEKTALAFRPKYSTDFKVAVNPADGQLHNYVLSDDGSPPKDTGLAVKPDMTEVDLGGTKQFVNKNTVAPDAIFKKTMTPDGVAADRRAAAQLSFQKSQADGPPEAAISDDAIKNAAARYNIDGTLPPMGMGKAAAAGRSAILNEAARQKAGVSGEQQRLDQLNNKGEVAARNAAVRSFATGKDGQIVQSANTALNHLDTIRELALAQKNGDWKAFNVAANRFASATGNPAPTNLRSALMMVGPEVAKAVGAAGTGHERDQAQQALNPDGSVDQILGGVQTMQELFGGRLSETKRTYERTTKNKDFSTFLSPAAQGILDQRAQHEQSTRAGANPATTGVKFLGFE